MQSPHHLLSDIQQQASDLAATIHLYERHYGPLPPSLQRQLSSLIPHHSSLLSELARVEHRGTTPHSTLLTPN